MSTKPDSQPQRKRVNLLKPHRHAGRDYQPGQSLELPEDKAEWLVALGVASAEPAPGTAAKPAKE